MTPLHQELELLQLMLKKDVIFSQELQQQGQEQSRAWTTDHEGQGRGSYHCPLGHVVSIQEPLMWTEVKGSAAACWASCRYRSKLQGPTGKLTHALNMQALEKLIPRVTYAGHTHISAPETRA